MPKITIDQYGLPIHERYAADITALENMGISFEESSISKDFELAQGSSLIQTKWDELFELHNKWHPYAFFGIPPNFLKMRKRKRFFTNALSPEFDWDEEEVVYKEKVNEMKSQLLPKAVFEKDRSAILALIDSIKTLNTLIEELNARQLQYQKG